MVFATAKFWGLQPHVVWHYPFRYYKELRDFYIASFQNSIVSGRSSQGIDWDADTLDGGPT